MKEKIIKANEELAKNEAEIYDEVHLEIFNEIEQQRLKEALSRAASKIRSGNQKALEIGCGTGNVTLKLLELGFDVTAVDLTKDYVSRLLQKAQKYRKCGKLRILTGKDYHKSLQSNSFDFVCCYSVLHHIPEPKELINKMYEWTKPGGIIYIDHETPSEVLERNKILQRCYDLSCGWLNGFYVYFIRRIPRKRTKLDYHLADYHAGQIKRAEIVAHFNAKKSNCVATKIYLLQRTKLWNPFKFIYRLFYDYDTVCWIARK